MRTATAYALRPLRLLRRDERGFMMIEAVAALVLFAVVVIALVGLLTSAISANTFSREKTIAEQVANDQVEWIRSRGYDNVGTTLGNPAGNIDPTGLKCPTPAGTCDPNPLTIRGVVANVETDIEYVDDPAPTSYATQANYKKVTVTIERASDGRQLAQGTTYVAPASRAPLGGLNNAIINTTVVDIGDSTLPGVGDATVGLSSTNPLAGRNDTTSQTGLVSFAALIPNPTSSDYYNLTVMPPSGYVVQKADDIAQTPTSPQARVSLAPAQTWTTTLGIYRPSTVYVNLTSSQSTATTTDDIPWTSSATVQLSGTPGTDSFACPGAVAAVYTCSGGQLTVWKIAGEPVQPGDYTVSVLNTVPIATVPPTPTSQYVPNSYPSDLTATYTGVIATTTLSLTIKKRPPGSGTNLASGTRVTVSVTGGPLWQAGDPAVYFYNGPVDASSRIPDFFVPVGSGYTVKAFLGDTCVAGSNRNRTGQSVNAPSTPTNAAVILLRDSPCPSLP
ncbi:MAG: hypothetical protein MSC30_13900 [Gaiellaceae bacterium MAG52_C11]|nr:hypothetical protein [Candidatus Gaiellasilicea maunaloa]